MGFGAAPHHPCAKKTPGFDLEGFLLGLQPTAFLGPHPYLPAHVAGHSTHTLTSQPSGWAPCAMPEAFSAPHTHSPSYWAPPCDNPRPAFAGPFPPCLSPWSKTKPNCGWEVLTLSVACRPPRGPFWAVSSYSRHPAVLFTHGTSPKLFWGYNFDPLILC